MRVGRPAKRAPRAFTKRKQRYVNQSKQLIHVMRELEQVLQSKHGKGDLEEKLRGCREAFQAGVAVEKMFHQTLTREPRANEERVLPPAGTVMPILI